MNTVYKVEVGEREKHTVELRNNMFTGVEEILVDGKTVVKKFSMSGVDETIEVGNSEKHTVRIKYGFAQLIGSAPIFIIDGGAQGKAASTAKRDMKGAAIGTAVTIGSFLLGQYIGLALVLVILAAAVFTFAYCKLGKGKVKAEAGLLAGVQTAYALWFFVAAVGLGQYAAVIFDFAVLAAFSAWLLMKPNKAAYITVIAFHGFGGIINTIQLFTPTPPDMRPYVVLHLALHVASIAIASVCLLMLKQKQPLAYPENK